MPGADNRRQRRTVGLALLVLAVLWIVFILTRSMKTAVDSGAESGRVLALVQRLFPLATDHAVRKLAHFTEFFLLGLLLGQSVRFLWKPSLWLPLVCGVGVAALDETIQLFVPGRSGEMRDALLDSLGVLCALLLLRLLGLCRKQ